MGIATSDLFPERESAVRRRIVATYDYADAMGELLFQVVRYDPKDFRQRRPDGRGGWMWKLGNTRRVLYRLPEVIAAVAAGQQVWIVEGERDADSLARCGYCATTNAQGAGKWHKVPDASTILAGADVVIVADADEPGRAHARDVAASLVETAMAITVVEPAKGKDISDHLAAGQVVSDLHVVASTHGDLINGVTLDLAAWLDPAHTYPSDSPATVQPPADASPGDIPDLARERTFSHCSEPTYERWVLWAKTQPRATSIC
jgi:5S rRNA maturation endonuclease (ribonuclease M5)